MARMRLGKKHPLVQKLREMRRDAAVRRAENCFVAEGRHLANEAVRSRASIEFTVIAPSLLEDAEGRALHRALELAGEVHTVEESVMQSLQDARSPQPVLVVATRPGAERSAEAGPGFPDLVLYGLQDPGNLGSILRSAEAAGVGRVFVLGDGADPYHPRAVRASMGSIFRVPPIETTLDDILIRRNSTGAELIGNAADEGDSLFEATFPATCSLVFGSEAAGLPPAIRNQLDRTVRIPMQEPVESLSVAAAAAVALFELARRRRF